MMYRQSARASRTGITLLASVLAAFISACSCGGGETSARDAVFSSSLTKDTSGKADYLINFGDVSVGDRKTLAVKITNPGSAELVVRSTPLQRPFSVDIPAAGFGVQIGGSRDLAFSFRPLEETPEEHEVTVTLSTNEAGGGKEHTVRLVGRGRAPRLDCEPGSLDFGYTPKGTAAVLALSCTNDFPFDIEGEANFEGSAHGRFFKLTEGDGTFRVPSEQTVVFEVRFTAEALGLNEANLYLRDHFNQDLAKVPLQGNVTATNLVVDPPSCLDFSYVMVGERKQQAFHVHTIGNQGMRLTGFEIAEESRESFSFVTQPPMELESGAEPTELWIEFHPTSAGSKQAQLAIRTFDQVEGERVVSACAKGFGGGPQLRCERDAIDFRMAAIGMPFHRPLSCVNDGLEAPGEAIDPLRIDTIESTNDRFTASIVGGVKPAGYRVGESFILDVVYLAEEETFDQGDIAITTLNHPDDSTLISVSGQGRALPPCEFAIDPPQLRFGVMNRGAEKTMRVTIRNQGDDSCLINDLRLSAGSDRAFHVDPIESLELMAGDRLVVEVTFAPQDYRGAVSGAVEFQISNPDNPFQSVPLQGTSANPCLTIDPADLDFGKVPPQCSSKDRWVSATNTCLTPITVTSFDIGDSSDPDAFQILQRPTLPKTLHTNERVELNLAFMPQVEGEHWGSLMVEVQGGDPFVGLLKGLGDHEAIQTDHFDQTSRPKVDILWVMDNSGSFNTYQDRVAANLPAFLSIASTNQVDYHIAVTTSGLTTSGSCPGGAQGGEDGRFFPVDGSHPRILTPNTLDLEAHWAHNMRVGTCHAVEEYFEAAFRALSEPLINETKSSKHAAGSPYNDGNAGFLRREAALSIIFVADEPEQSTKYGKTPMDYLAFFKSLKGPNALRIHAISGSKSTDHSPCGLNNGDRFHTLVEATDGTWLDICTPKHDNEAWEEGMTLMSEGAFSFQGRFVLRGSPADVNGDRRVDEDDIELYLNGVLYNKLSSAGLPRWSYDPIGNAIDFAPLYVPRAGSQISATYKVKCESI